MTQMFENFVEQRENPAKEATTAQSTLTTTCLMWFLYLKPSFELSRNIKGPYSGPKFNKNHGQGKIVKLSHFVLKYVPSQRAFLGFQKKYRVACHVYCAMLADNELSKVHKFFVVQVDLKTRDRRGGLCPC